MTTTNGKAGRGNSGSADPRRCRPRVRIVAEPVRAAMSSVSSSDRRGGRLCHLKWYRERVHSTALEFLRHECTNYHQLLNRYCPYRTNDAAYAVVRARVHAAIEKAYPDLESEIEIVARELYAQAVAAGVVAEEQND